MRPWKSAALVVAALASTSACRPAADADALAAELRGLVRTGYVEPFRSGDVDRWVEIFTDDALALHDGPPVIKGREQIRGFGVAVRENFEIREFDVVVDEVRSNGDWALTTGHYRADFVPRNAEAYQGAAGPRQGKFLFLWERRDGTWRIMTDMGNSTDPMPAAEAGGAG